MEGPSKIGFPFPEASTLVFENLPSLVSFGSANLDVQWPSLENVTIENCPSIKPFGLGHLEVSQLKSAKVDSEAMVAHYFQLSDKFSIDEYNIDDAEELSKTLAVKLTPMHFTNLVRLQAKNCDERLNEFLYLLLGRSKRLECLTIKECKLLRHVFDLSRPVTKPDAEGNGKYFAWLKKMQLCELPHLTCIWNRDPIEFFGLGRLEHIEIEKCGSLKNLMSISTAENLQQLHVLRVHSCEKIEEVVAMETQGLEIQKGEIEFPQLQELELMDLLNLIKFHRGTCALEFPYLNYLRIKNCPQMISFTTGFASAEEFSVSEGRSFTELRELELDTCGKLIYVIHSIMLPRFLKLEKLIVNNCDLLMWVIQFHGECYESYDGMSMVQKLSELKFSSTKFFQNLQILRVKNCKSLQYLFLPFAADSCMLRAIEISDCKALEEIIVTTGAEASGKILFSHLNSIALENLPKLSTFSLGTFEFPLEGLTITNCPEMKTFLSGFPEMKNLPAAPLDNFFKNFESFVNVKKLLIVNQTGVEKLWHNKHPSSSIYELEELTLNKSYNLLNVIPPRMVGRLNKLRIFTVEGCEQLTEVFDLEDIPDHDVTEILPQLNAFTLCNLPILKHVWNKEPHFHVFQNLVSLQIIECHELKNLFSLSTAKHLQQLKLLKLYDCKNMEEVFVDEKGKISEDIVFDNVECLVLKQLPSLVSFCQQCITFKWPKLRKVRVCEIPKMETFAQGNQITPLLKTVYITYIKKCWQGDLNNTIQYLHNSAEFEMRKATGEGTSGGG